MAHGRQWIPCVAAVIGTLALHVAVFSPMLLGGGARNARAAAAVGGFGVSTGSEAESQSVMTLIDLSGLSEANMSIAETPVVDAALTPTMVFVASEIPAPPPLPIDESALEPASEASPAAGNPEASARMFGRYMNQIAARIERAWVRPRTPIGAPQFECQTRIEQDGRGRVLSVELMDCRGSTEWQESLVRAIERAAPLSAPPEPSVFTPTVTLTFTSGEYVAGVSAENEYEPTHRLARSPGITN